MIHYAVYNEVGKYIAKGTVVSEEHLPDGNTYIGDVDSVNQYHDLISNGPVEKGTPPGSAYTFDYAAKAWGFDSRIAWADVVRLRDYLLTESDWRVLPDAGQSTLWIDYRQALRDITEQPDPLNIIWPTPPV